MLPLTADSSPPTIRLCLAAAIEHSDAPKVKCPFKDDSYSCDMDMLEREIKALVTPAILEKHQKKSVKEAEANIQNAFHCKVRSGSSILLSSILRPLTVLAGR